MLLCRIAPLGHFVHGLHQTFCLPHNEPHGYYSFVTQHDRRTFSLNAQRMRHLAQLCVGEHLNQQLQLSVPSFLLSFFPFSVLSFLCFFPSFFLHFDDCFFLLALVPFATSNQQRVHRLLGTPFHSRSTNCPRSSTHAPYPFHLT